MIQTQLPMVNILWECYIKGVKLWISSTNYWLFIDWVETNIRRVVIPAAIWSDSENLRLSLIQKSVKMPWNL